MHVTITSIFTKSHQSQNMAHTSSGPKNHLILFKFLENLQKVATKLWHCSSAKETCKCLNVKKFESVSQE